MFLTGATDMHMANILWKDTDKMPASLFPDAFINISERCSCYLDLDTVKNPLFSKRQSEKKISMGDTLIVQVVKEEVKTKAPNSPSTEQGGVPAWYLLPHALQFPPVTLSLMINLHRFLTGATDMHMANILWKRIKRSTVT